MLKKKGLPDFFTFEGKIFYFLSKHRYVGVPANKIAKEFKLTLLELLQFIITLYEKGLITLLKEGKTIGDDVWDVASDLRKKDPDIQKIINTTKYLEKSLDDRLKELKELADKREIEKIRKLRELP
ncbi:MAG: hypothetical protein HWN67_17520 [Candidatus Helarchaeota archaeon]|nr:hypothetical protein [Candidatus Helarchaeota archaeon]